MSLNTLKPANPMDMPRKPKRRPPPSMNLSDRSVEDEFVTIVHEEEAGIKKSSSRRSSHNYWDLCEKLIPEVMDLSTDMVRLRWMAPFVFVLLFYLVIAAFGAETLTDAVITSKMGWVIPIRSASSSSGLQHTLSGTIRLVDQNGLPMANRLVTSTLKSWTTYGNIDCDSTTMESLNGTLYYYQLKTLCIPIISAAVKTGSQGLAIINSSTTSTGGTAQSGVYQFTSSYVGSDTLNGKIESPDQTAQVYGEVAHFNSAIADYKLLTRSYV